jgi:hypothetical protein
MIARGAIHNPDIFNEYKEMVKNHQNINQLNVSEIDNDNEIIEENICDKEKNSKQTNKNNKKKEADNDLQISNNLCKILEKKYGDRSIDIINIIKEYIEIVFINKERQLDPETALVTLNIMSFIFLKLINRILNSSGKFKIFTLFLRCGKVDLT